jgi:hypothetical protein
MDSIKDLDMVMNNLVAEPIRKNILFMVSQMPSGLLHEDLTRMTQSDIIHHIEYLLDSTFLSKLVDVKSERKSYTVAPFFHSYIIERMTDKNKKETLLHLAEYFEL